MARPLAARLLLLLLVLVSGGAGAGRAMEPEALGVPAHEADLSVGCLYPMSGRAGGLGRDSVVGLKLALRYIAERTDGPWPQLRVYLGDTKSKRSTAVNLAERLIDNHGVRFLCGVVNSSVAIEISGLARERGVFFIGTDHASSRLTGEFLHETYFRVSNDSRQSMSAGALYVKDHFADILRTRPLTIAYLGPDYEYGYQVWRDFRAALEAFAVPYTVSSVLWPRLNEPDYSPYIAHLVETKPDLVVNSLWGGDMIAFVSQALQSRLFTTSRFANFEKGGDYEAFATLGDKMPTGLILSSRHHNNWPTTALNRWFVNQFHEETGAFPSSGAEGAFTGLLAIAEAARAVGPPYADKAALIAAFETLSLETPEDPPGFRSTMDPDTHQMRQVIAIGETVSNTAFPPATVMLGNWRVYRPEDYDVLAAPKVLRRRAEAGETPP